MNSNNLISEIKQNLYNINKKTSIAEEFKKSLGKTFTIESIIYAEDSLPSPEEDMPPMDNSPQGNQPSPEMSHDDNGEISMDRVSPDIQRKVNAIRKMALEGVTQLAENPGTPEYEFFKKVFMDCDKVFEKNGKNKI